MGQASGEVMNKEPGISIQDFQKKLKENNRSLIIDVRSEEEYMAGYIMYFLKHIPELNI